ncbi:hypothetical protein JOF56_003719 [Kibdelosporangium banguiense]|uniref:ANTAR domain-containing protein n=1 Tax=Kibdelosporangium banguiense TaxID=1365924 RepID=A0ABS4TH62_9PSEU|nr:hypothetical protein [Kibdelosporangium banguiense]MBP2323334.1 hypothetical protein [Kibdelosporangium banguiense]
MKHQEANANAVTLSRITVARQLVVDSYDLAARAVAAQLKIETEEIASQICDMISEGGPVYADAS